MNVQVNWNDAPPEVRTWYLKQLELAEQAQDEERALEAGRRADGPVVKPPFAPEDLTAPDGTVYRQVTESLPDAETYRKHLSEVHRRLSGEHQRT